jgi:hypothetical protein
MRSKATTTRAADLHVDKTGGSFDIGDGWNG